MVKSVASLVKEEPDKAKCKFISMSSQHVKYDETFKAVWH